MNSTDDRDRRIAELQDQVEVLEAIVRRRSDELRLIQKLACRKDRLMIASIFDGGAMRALQLASIDEYYSMNWFAETTHFLPSSVEEVLGEVWLTPPGRPTGPEQAT